MKLLLIQSKPYIPLDPHFHGDDNYTNSLERDAKDT